jgi:hypothetical protein
MASPVTAPPTKTGKKNANSLQLKFYPTNKVKPFLSKPKQQRAKRPKSTKK